MRSIRLALPLILLAFIVNSCAEQAQMPGRAFEGTITQVIKMPGLMKAMSGDSGAANSGMGAMMGAAANVNLKIYAREDRVAYEAAMLGGLIKVKSIVNRSTRTITTLLPNKVAQVTDFRQLDAERKQLDDSINQSGIADSIAENLPQPTGRTMEINGFQAEEYTGKIQGMDVEMWLTEDPRMQFYEIVRDAVLGRRRTGAGGLEEVFAMFMPISKGKVPLKFTAKLNGEVFMTSEMTNLEEGELEDAVFEIPAGYQVVKENPMEVKRDTSSKLPIDTTVLKQVDSIRRSITGRPE